MKNWLVAALAAVGILSGSRAFAQTPLPRAGWVATASSSSATDVPSRAIDGSSGTRFSTGADQSPGQWFSLDMQTPQAFSQITIDPTGSTNDFTQAYQVFVSNDAVTWGVPVASGTGSGGVLTIMFPTQTARFVGIVQTGTGSHWWSIGEINVYGPGAVPTVLLTPSGWTASASSTGGSDVASRAIDSSPTTRWTSGTPQANGQWFQVDLGTSQPLAKISMNSDGSSSDYARGYQVFVSNSTTSWGAPVATGTGSSALITVPFAPATGRYLRIVQTGSASNWWSIADLQIYGVGTFEPVAMAFPRSGWTATASATCGTDVPARVLDDSASTRWSTGLNQASGQSFQLDLQAPLSFTKLTLDAGASSNDYPRGYAVYVSNDGTSWGTPVATGSGTSALVTVNFSYRTARYIKIALTTGTSSNWWSIHELNVYGTPPVMLPHIGWTAGASSNTSTAGNALDGKPATRWTTGVNQTSGQTFDLDLLAPQAFDQLTLDAAGFTNDYPRNFEVYASNDQAEMGDPIATGVGTAALVSLSFPTQIARYLRVRQIGFASFPWSIAEATLFLRTSSTCTLANGSKAPDWTPCDDGDLCHRAKSCRGGACVGGQNKCDDGDKCTADVCINTEGVCSHVPLGQAFCDLSTAGGVPIKGRVAFATEEDNNRCVPDAKHILNRINARGEVMGWHYHNAGYPGLSGGTWHTQSIVRMPHIVDSEFGLNGGVFFSLWSDPTDPWFGVARMGFKGGRQGRMLGSNRAYFRNGVAAADWHAHPNVEDTFLASAFRRRIAWTGAAWGFDDRQNHPGGAAAIGTRVVAALQQFTPRTSQDGFCLHFLCSGEVPGTSKPWVYLADISNPDSPELVSAFLTEGTGVGNDAAGIVKLADGHFLLVVYKGGPSRLEFYYSPHTELNFKELVPGQPTIGVFGEQGRPADAVVPWSGDLDYTSMNILTDCSGEMFLLGLNGEKGPSESADELRLHRLSFFDGAIPAATPLIPGLPLGSQGCGPRFCAKLTAPGCEHIDILTGDCIPDPSLATAPIGASNAQEKPLHQKNMFCSDNDNDDECDFKASAGSYIDPDGKVIVYATNFDDDGNAESGFMVGGGTPIGGYIRGMEYHEQHGNFAAASACPTSQDAWVELYGYANFNKPSATVPIDGRNYLMQFISRTDRDNGHLAVNDFNDQTSSVRWCVPPGSSVILWHGDPGTSSKVVLNGTGKVAGIASFTNMTFPNGVPLNDNVSGIEFSTSDPAGITGTPDDRN